MIETEYLVEVNTGFSKLFLGFGTYNVIREQLQSIIYTTTDTTTQYLSSTTTISVYDLIQEETYKLTVVISEAFLKNVAPKFDPDENIYKKFHVL